MSANIMLSDRAIYRRQPAWHGLGEVFPEDLRLTASDAIAKARLDFKIGKFPLYTYVKYGGTEPKLVSLASLGAVETNDDDGTTRLVGGSNLKAIIRQPAPGDPHYRVLGTCTDSYEIIDNKRIAQILNPLSKTYPVETAFALGRGETLVITLRGKPYDVLGDGMTDYTCVVDSKDAKGGLYAVNTPVRMVCQNTVVTGLGEATASFNIPHSKDADMLLRFAVQMLRQVEAAGEKNRASFNALALKSLVEDQVSEILLAAYPEPTVPKTRAAVVAAAQSGELAGLVGLDKDTRQTLADQASSYIGLLEVRKLAQDMLRGSARALYERFNDTVEARRTAGTAWALYQAVVEQEDYKDGKGRIFESALFGERAKVKTRAFASALKIAQS